MRVVEEVFLVFIGIALAIALWLVLYRNAMYSMSVNPEVEAEKFSILTYPDEVAQGSSICIVLTNSWNKAADLDVNYASFGSKVSKVTSNECKNVSPGNYCKICLDVNVGPGVYKIRIDGVLGSATVRVV